MVLAEPNVLSIWGRGFSADNTSCPSCPSSQITQNNRVYIYDVKYGLNVSEEKKKAMIRPVLKVEKWRSYFSVFFLKFDQMTSGFPYSPDKTPWGFESAQS